MKTNILIIPILIIAIIACNKKESINNNNIIHFGDSFILKMNGSINVASSSTNNDSILTVCFKKVISDSRCPSTSCSLCYGSAANIQILLVQKKDTSNIYLIIPGCSSEPVCNEYYYYRKDTLGYRICLLSLDPYPNSNTPIKAQDYSAKLKISKL